MTRVLSFRDALPLSMQGDSREVPRENAAFAWLRQSEQSAHAGAAKRGHHAERHLLRSPAAGTEVVRALPTGYLPADHRALGVGGADVDAAPHAGVDDLGARARTWRSVCAGVPGNASSRCRTRSFRCRRTRALCSGSRCSCCAPRHDLERSASRAGVVSSRGDGEASDVGAHGGVPSCGPHVPPGTTDPVTDDEPCPRLRSDACSGDPARDRAISRRLPPRRRPRHPRARWRPAYRRCRG